MSTPPQAKSTRRHDSGHNATGIARGTSDKLWWRSSAPMFPEIYSGIPSTAVLPAFVVCHARHTPARLSNTHTPCTASPPWRRHASAKHCGPRLQRHTLAPLPPRTPSSSAITRTDINGLIITRRLHSEPSPSSRKPRSDRKRRCARFAVHVLVSVVKASGFANSASSPRAKV